MADPIAIANAVAKSFGGSTPSAQAGDATPSASPSPSGNGDADKANAALHADLQGTICPDCHAAVKKVMTTPQNSNYDADGNELPIKQQHSMAHH